MTIAFQRPPRPRSRSHTYRFDREGAALPLIAVLLVFLFVAAVIGIDVARMHVVRSELRTATDAAARAGVEAIGRTESRAAAVQAALDIARLNLVAGVPLDLDPDNIVFGASVENPDGSFSFVEQADFDPSDATTFANSVRVLGERTAGSPNGPINLLFGGIFGVDTFAPFQSATATRLDRDIALVLDKSGSMAENGRFESLLDGVDVFVDELNATAPVENVSLTAYDTFPTKLLEMTKDLESIRTAIASVQPEGFTGIGRAMRVGLDSLLNDPNSRNLALRSMIVMTDGNQNRGIGPLIAAEECRAANVVVHTITFSNGADEALMRDVAEITGGTHLHATNNEQLVEAFRTIARQLEVILIE